MAMELRILSDEETVEPSLGVSPRREAPPAKSNDFADDFADDDIPF